MQTGVSLTPALVIGHETAFLKPGLLMYRRTSR